MVLREVSWLAVVGVVVVGVVARAAPARADEAQAVVWFDELAYCGGAVDESPLDGLVFTDPTPFGALVTGVEVHLLAGATAEPVTVSAFVNGGSVAAAAAVTEDCVCNLGIAMWLSCPVTSFIGADHADGLPGYRYADDNTIGFIVDGPPGALLGKAVVVTVRYELCGGASCDDGDVCTVDACSELGCSSDTIPGCCHEDAECRDGSFCNGVEQCVGNACVSGPPPCDDGDACTYDWCTDISGCGHTPIADCCTTNADCGFGSSCVGGECVSRWGRWWRG